MGLKAIFAYMAIASIIISFNTVISEDNEVRPYAQTQVDDYERISYSFSFDSPSFNEMIVYDNQYTSINLPGCVMLGKDVGEPAMPVKFIKILLPPAKSVKNIESGNGDPPPPAGGDTTAPAAPTNVGCTTLESDDTPSFSWNPATDFSGIAGYYVKIDDGSDIWIRHVTTWTTTSAIEDGAHTLYVKARDASSNKNIGNYETCFFIINTIIVAGLPVANAGGPYYGLTFENIFFDGSGSYDTNGTITNYTWNLGDGTIFFGEQVIYDLEEVEFNTNKSDSNDSPIDNDGDRVPDEYDEDDDNDGLVDHLEEAWGSDPYNNSDVIVVDIEGREYYLIDSDKDGIINKFCNPVGRITTVDVTDDGNYLIDMDGDAKWDYIYNPASGEITVYSEEASSDDFPWSLVIIGIVIAIIVIILVLYLTGYRIWIEEN